MKTGSWIVGAAVAALTAGCTTTPRPLNDAERAAIADSVNAVVTQWGADFSKRPTVEDYMTGFVAGNEVVHVQNMVIYPTRDSLVAGARAALRSVVAFPVTVTQKRFFVLERDVVVLSAMVHGLIRDSAGRETAFNEAWLAVYHRTPSGWKIAADNETTAPVAPPTPAKAARGH